MSRAQPTIGIFCFGLGVSLAGACVPKDFTFDDGSPGSAASSAGGAGSASTSSSGSGSSASSSSGGGGGDGGASSSSAAASSTSAASGGGGGGSSISCGDGALDPGEACDDGNVDDGDACSSNCLCGPADLGTYTDPMTGHCYAAYKSDQSTWADAKALCEQKGAYLASLQSAGERDFLAANYSAVTNLWIGANDIAKEGVWVWASGEPWLMKPCSSGVAGCDDTVDLWDPGEPEDPMGMEDCGYFSPDFKIIGDIGCDMPRPTLCERSPLP